MASYLGADGNGRGDSYSEMRFSRHLRSGALSIGEYRC
jgi:hypothetical protein